MRSEHLFSLKSPLLAGVLFVSLASIASAQETGTPSRPATQATIVLTRALERIGNPAGVLVVADSTVAYERIPLKAIEDSAAKDEAALEEQIRALVRTLPAGTIWGKLYLPPPAPGRTWKGDDISALAFAQARLFGNIGEPTSDGSIEILGKRVDKDSAATYIKNLGLKPVYLITNPRRQAAISATPWSSLTQEQWSNLSPEDRKQYGMQQANWIMSLSPEQRDQMLKDIRQHDKYFDTVKDPLEKLLGHDL